MVVNLLPSLNQEEVIMWAVCGGRPSKLLLFPIYQFNFNTEYYADFSSVIDLKVGSQCTRLAVTRKYLLLSYQ